MVARQKIHAGMIHAGKTGIVICENNHFEVIIDGEIAAVVPRTTTSEIQRCKANATPALTAGPCQGITHSMRPRRPYTLGSRQ